MSCAINATGFDIVNIEDNSYTRRQEKQKKNGTKKKKIDSNKPWYERLVREKGSDL
jgi:hypothetical protein